MTTVSGKPGQAPAELTETDRTEPVRHLAKVNLPLRIGSPEGWGRVTPLLSSPLEESAPHEARLTLEESGR